MSIYGVKGYYLSSEMYKKQMTEGIPQRQVITLETRHMTQTLTHLEEKIGELKKFGEQLAMSMEGAAVSDVMLYCQRFFNPTPNNVFYHS